MMGKISIGTNIIYDDTQSSSLYDEIPNPFASSEFSSTYPVKNAFDNSMSSIWSASGSIGQFIGIDFKKAVNVKKLYLLDNQNRLKDFVFEGSQDNTVYTPILTAIRPQVITEVSFDIVSSIYYRYYRVRCSGTLYTGSNFGMANLRMGYETV